MLHPSYNELINVVNSEVEQPVVKSRYSIVIATSKRARQIVSKEDTEGVTHGKKPLSIAIEEIRQQKVRIVTDDKSNSE